MIGNLFKQRAHYVFNYTPRFYNERKERLEALKKKYENEQLAPSEIKIPINFRASWKKNKVTTNSSANMRIAIIIVVLVLFAYLYLKYLGISFF
ncbi:MAG: hypothetical protein CO023_00455 [Flavobacteriales bacterium CG_4_9_14_0_2_um_filter_35_242]|nr:hypothetical protein [Zetaproteobacteria bacterium]NDK17458.1 hypothetical protein [Flavobacteriales bacterium]OIO11309.1 MAG: hypothetical protein AUJ53_04845 [Flavobacteriaceae bacterium CG1_02_35_72]PIR13690.1 MAG: hypothetical protein COV50_05595 [Flavobacteriales bacterium CG11_big_fil_rev_8_21_14_0_20_35_7]PIV17740.1 MAG: hypothetical protein COS42_03365 [Flavobacteriales bacterium CG03_land_8_20_14_0_80_35_15]PIX05902.1 MAG: hypothetical protein COZ76_11755 [Flavobacteriales bacteriu